MNGKERMFTGHKPQYTFFSSQTLYEVTLSLVIESCWQDHLVEFKEYFYRELPSRTTQMNMSSVLVGIVNMKLLCTHSAARVLVGDIYSLWAIS